MTKIKEHNIATGEIIERDMTADELAVREADLARDKAAREMENLLAASKAALLEKLGITEDEAKLLLS